MGSRVESEQARKEAAGMQKSRETAGLPWGCAVRWGEADTRSQIQCGGGERHVHKEQYAQSLCVMAELASMVLKHMEIQRPKAV